MVSLGNLQDVTHVFARPALNIPQGDHLALAGRQRVNGILQVCLGAVLLGGGGGRNYMVHASRREAPGMAEIHTKDTDIIYVLEGTATFVTGGTAVDPKNIAADEIRGSSISGGETRKLTKGDVIIVPNGVPHWFRQIQGSFLYYVVKVR